MIWRIGADRRSRRSCRAAVARPRLEPARRAAASCGAISPRRSWSTSSPTRPVLLLGVGVGTTLDRHRHGVARHDAPLPGQPDAEWAPAAAAGAADLYHRLRLCRPAGLRRARCKAACAMPPAGSAATTGSPTSASAGGVAAALHAGALSLRLSRRPRRVPHPVAAADRSEPHPGPRSVANLLRASACRWRARRSPPAWRWRCSRRSPTSARSNITACRPSRRRSIAPGTAWAIARAPRRSPLVLLAIAGC